MPTRPSIRVQSTELRNLEDEMEESIERSMAAPFKRFGMELEISEEEEQLSEPDLEVSQSLGQELAGQSLGQELAGLDLGMEESSDASSVDP